MVSVDLFGSGSQALTKHQLFGLCWHLITRMLINNVHFFLIARAALTRLETIISSWSCRTHCQTVSVQFFLLALHLPSHLPAPGISACKTDKELTHQSSELLMSSNAGPTEVALDIKSGKNYEVLPDMDLGSCRVT